MQRINYKIAFYIILIMGTVMSSINCFLYGNSMMDWLSIISVTSCGTLLFKGKSEKKILHSFMAIIMLILAILFMIRYLMERGTIQTNENYVHENTKDITYDIRVGVGVVLVLNPKL